MGALDYIAHAFNTINWGKNRNIQQNFNRGSGSTVNRHKITNSGGVYASSLSRVVFNRIATDAAMIPFYHIRADVTANTESIMKSKLQERLSLEANIDQSAYQFFHELVYNMCDEDAIAVVPTETTTRLKEDGGSFDIDAMRIGRITQWYPKDVEVELYNDDTGNPERIVVPKATTAILENPFGEVLDRKNGTLQRLKRKMALLDLRDEEISSGRLNMLIQLPYSIKGKVRREQATERKNQLEEQLKDNAYGIAYTGVDEKVTPLNNPIDNDLADQVKYLRIEFFNQLGLTENIFNGTASELELNNYFSRAIEPILTAIKQEFKRKFLSKTGRSQGQDIIFIRDPFKLIAAENLADITDTFLRNAVATPNEMRSKVGLMKHPDKTADELYNRNIADVNQQGAPLASEDVDLPTEATIEPASQNGGISTDLQSYFFEEEV